MYIAEMCLNPRVTRVGSTPTPSVFVDNFLRKKSKNYFLLGIPRGFNSAYFEGSTTTGGGPVSELSFSHPSHLDQFGTHVSV